MAPSRYVLFAALGLSAPALADEPTVPSTEDDDAYVVTVTADPQSVQGAPGSVTVIDGDTLRATPAADLTDVLRQAPGVTLTAGSQGRRGISLRGMDPSYTLILVDGRRVNSSDAVFRHNDFDIGMLPLDAIERIEIVRGAMSSLYGSDALGGVIHIITRPVDDTWSAGATLQLQSPTRGSGGQEARLSGMVSGPLIKDRLALRVYGNAGLRSVWHGASDPKEVLRDDEGEPVVRDDGSAVHAGDLATLEGRSDHGLRSTLTWTPDDRQTVRADYRYGYQHRRGEYYISGWGEADAAVRRHDASLSHEGDWDWGRTEARVYWEGLDTGVDGTHQDNIVGEVRASTTLGGHALKAGADVRATRLVSEEQFDSGSASVHQEGAYAQGLFTVHRTLNLLVGGRLDHHPAFGLWGTPRAYAVWRPSEVLVIKGGVGTGYKSPALRQTRLDARTTSCRGACLIVGNEHLGPEASSNSELSVQLDTERFGASVTVYNNDVRGLITTPRGEGVDPIGVDEATGLPMYVPVNVSRARLRGAELGLQGSPTDWLSARVGWDLLDARDLDNDVRLDYRPKQRVTGQLDLQPVGDLLSIFARGEHIGEQQSGEAVVAPYTLFDAGAQLSPSDAFSLRLGVLNLADTRTADSAGYAFQERGRSVYLSLSLRS